MPLEPRIYPAYFCDTRILFLFKYNSIWYPSLLNTRLIIKSTLEAMVRQGGAGEAEELVTVDLDMWSNRLFGMGGKAGQMVRVQCKLLKILFEKSVFSTWCKQ